jgi:hypothetical protein
MCRKNIFVVLIYLCVSILAGSYLGYLVVNLTKTGSSFISSIFYFFCVVIVALFLTPVLDYFSD